MNVTTSNRLRERSQFPMAVTAGAGHSLRHGNTAFCALHSKDIQDLPGYPFVEALSRAIGDSISARYAQSPGLSGFFRGLYVGILRIRISM